MTEQDLIKSGYTGDGITEIKKLADANSISLAAATSLFEGNYPPPVTKEDWEREAAKVRQHPGMEKYDYVPEHLK